MSEQILRYLNTRMAYMPGFTSDETHVNFITNITGIPQVWRVELPGADRKPRWPVQLTFGEDRVQSVISSRKLGDDRIIFGRDAGGNENAQLFLLDPTKSQEICLTEGYADAMHIPSEWSKDAKRIIFGANRRDKSLFDLYIHDLESGKDRMIWQNETPGFPWNARFSPDGMRVVVPRLHSNFDTTLFEIDIESGGVRMVSPETESVLYTHPYYTADGKSLIIITDLDSDTKYISKLEISTGNITSLYKDQWDVETVELSPNGRYLAFAVNEEGASTLYLHDLHTDETRPGPLADDPGLIGTSFSFSEDSTQIVFDYISATRVMDIYVWQIHQNTAHAITQSSHGGLPLDSFIKPELVRYPTFDKDENGETRTIPAWFYRPENAKGDVPVVVIVHGGPEGQSRPAFNFLIQYLLQVGYAAFVPNVRGSVGYGKAYSHLDDVEKRMDSVADLAYGAEWLKKQSGIDGNRIVVYGGSYGGFMVLAAVTHYPDLWAAGVDIVGISNLATFLENTSDYRRPAREAEYGTLAHERDFLESIAPIYYIDRVKVPLLVIHGANDPRVPLSEAEQMVAALKERNIPVEFIVFDDEGHGVVKLKNKLVMYPAVVDFLNKYV